MSDYDVTELDHAVSLGLTLANRTEWRGGVHRYVYSDVAVEAMLRAEYGTVDAGMAMTLLRSGRVRLLQANLGRESRCVGKALGYRTAVQ